jgi:lysozyme family protein
MKSNFETSLAYVLKSEGGFQKDERDPGNAKGGMTNLGCTKAVWEEFVGHPVSEADMRALTPASVAPLYKRKYWDKVAGDDLPAGLDYAVFDAAINSGPGRAAKWLQEVAGVPADGSIGKQTLAAVDAFSPLELIAQYNDKRLQFLESLPTFATFGKGWSNRVSSVQSIASQQAA